MRVYTGREIANKKMEDTFTKVEDLRTLLKRFSAYKVLERNEHNILTEANPSWKEFDKIIRKELLASLEKEVKE